MMRLKEIGHVLLRVMDLERSKKFYSEVLGFQVLEEDPEHGGTFMALPGQSHAIDLFQVKDAQAAEQQTPGVRGLGHIAFRVESEGALKDAYATLEEHAGPSARALAPCLRTRLPLGRGAAHSAAKPGRPSPHGTHAAHPQGRGGHAGRRGLA